LYSRGGTGLSLFPAEEEEGVLGWAHGGIIHNHRLKQAKEASESADAATPLGEINELRGWVGDDPLTDQEVTDLLAPGYSKRLLRLIGKGEDGAPIQMEPEEVLRRITLVMRDATMHAHWAIDREIPLEVLSQVADFYRGFHRQQLERPADQREGKPEGEHERCERLKRELQYLDDLRNPMLDDLLEQAMGEIKEIKRISRSAYIPYFNNNEMLDGAESTLREWQRRREGLDPEQGWSF
jgi:hypothetical protein